MLREGTCCCEEGTKTTDQLCNCNFFKVAPVVARRLRRRSSLDMMYAFGSHVTTSGAGLESLLWHLPPHVNEARALISCSQLPLQDHSVRVQVTQCYHGRRGYPRVLHVHVACTASLALDGMTMGRDSAWYMDAKISHTAITPLRLVRSHRL
ncbi:hypothetical protein P153DRAFT_147030 [Dothidotthia symphoricarpi CBS 119687]|uniref:Uncharacterized protein n=1 Tax=Dothidotthia symphoricarpi CBS 119687 TaxID=1392245 RepID=A0A6A5ZYG1_9PLEO|nr:uncharacterized protein P153DRAFT_147030 [Dothidotthia symphoricarpi CBS 119687]KAF2123817.1 hypothetical protein P153DRAFT_147030 [Dothidotthia symphoricarpi CBS 119687]